MAISYSPFYNIYFHLSFGLLIRFCLLVYGEYHDRNNSVQYTDTDYHVLTDAARYVSLGESPFHRHTYRYTPFLSWLMLPNLYVHMFAGKILFCLVDIFATLLLYKILQLSNTSVKVSTTHALLWLYNPIIIGISTRGSPESLIVTLVLLVLYFHLQNKLFLSGVTLGLAVHLKIYPIIYSLPLYLSLEPWTTFSPSVFFPTKKRLVFSLSAALSFLALTFYAYTLYGEEFIDEALLYHMKRVDTRHNFSIYFYLLYLAVGYEIPYLGLITFTPQMLIVAAYGFVYGTKEHIILSLFAQTISFVTFNKVVTSQYFVWYLVFVPLICHKLQMTKLKTCLLPAMWLFAQAAWLLPAYLFEFKGIDSFLPIWLESIAFFCCNVGILMAVLSSYGNKIKVN